jgi:hypothetical protein
MADKSVDDSTFNEERNERDRILREHGYDPHELTDEEKNDILSDILDDDPDNDRLGNVVSGDERDGTDA